MSLHLMNIYCEASTMGKLRKNQISQHHGGMTSPWVVTLSFCSPTQREKKYSSVVGPQKAPEELKKKEKEVVSGSAVLLASSRHPALQSEARLLAGEGPVLARRELGLVPHAVSGVSGAARSTPQGRAICSPSVAVPASWTIKDSFAWSAIITSTAHSALARWGLVLARGVGGGRAGAVGAGHVSVGRSQAVPARRPWRTLRPFTPGGGLGAGRGALPLLGALKPQGGFRFPVDGRPLRTRQHVHLSVARSSGRPGSLAPLGSPFPAPGSPARSRLLCPGLHRGWTRGRWFRPDPGPSSLPGFFHFRILESRESSPACASPSSSVLKAHFRQASCLRGSSSEKVAFCKDCVCARA
ncbi:hypothetical protein AAY473_025934 [Plecturocebus cupreus]